MSIISPRAWESCARNNIILHLFFHYIVLSHAVVYFRFEDDRNDVIQDDSSNTNVGKLIAPASTPSFSETCGKGLQLNGGALLISGDTFKEKPNIAFTISSWVNIANEFGNTSLFNTVDGASSKSKSKQYDIKIENGKFVCLHRNEAGKLVFRVASHQSLKPRIWNHVACTYDSQLGRSAMFVNGKQDATGKGD
jgi:hypothetical protein